MGIARAAVSTRATMLAPHLAMHARAAPQVTRMATVIWELMSLLEGSMPVVREAIQPSLFTRALANRLSITCL